jgi:hypothetical protein
MHGIADAVLAETPDRLELGPGGRDVNGEQRREVKAARGFAAAHGEIALQGARRDRGPVVPRLQRNLLPQDRERGTGAIELPPARRATAGVSAPA